MIEPWALQIIAQLPIVGLFIWYNEVRERRTREERLDRDREWREWMAAREDSRIKLRDELHMRMATELARLASAIEKIERKG